MSAQYPSTCLVLLVEDDSIVAFNLEDDLVGAGYKVAGPFATCAAAMTWLSTETPDLAVLDIMLKDGPSKDLAAELTQRDVPFVVFSASSQRRNTIREFANVAWIEKPASGDMVLQALANLQIGQVRREA